MRRSSSGYTPDWPEVAQKVKDAAGWKCVRCGHMHDRDSGHILTVHHLDLNPSNNAWWNTPALCQRCHLHIQGKVIMERPWMLAHSEWFRPYVAGYYAHLQGRDESREYVEAHMEELIASQGAKA
jgi:5-methylcytosine-specific restriction endonuclease McrA